MFHNMDTWISSFARFFRRADRVSVTSESSPTLGVAGNVDRVVESSSNVGKWFAVLKLPSSLPCCESSVARWLGAVPFSRGRLASGSRATAGPFLSPTELPFSSSQRVLLLFTAATPTPPFRYGLTGLLPVMGVVGRDGGRPGLVLALDGSEERPVPGCRSAGLRPTLHLGVSDIGLVRREEGLDGV
jgi:hypothetical protein